MRLMIYYFLLPCISVVGTLANLLTLIAFWKEPKLREKPPDLLILALACVDFFIGLAVVPILSPLYILPGNWPFAEIGCRLLIASSTATITGSMFLVIGISVDRYLLVSRDYSVYVKMQSTRKIQMNIIFGLGTAFLAAIIEQSFWEYGKQLDEIAANIDFNQFCLSPPRRVAAFSSVYLILFYCAPVLVVGVFSVSFFILLLKRIKKVRRVASVSSRLRSITAPSADEGANRPSTETSALENEDFGIRNRYIKPGLTLSALVIAMGTSMLPYCLYVVIVEWICSECSNTTVLYNVLLLTYVNACLDPILYAATQSKIRRFYKARITALFQF
ncbi:trace amine-associated receptor 7e-like [Amphiura filiformis]|uniref:trace amine-associated receptor 7e-like n=1 Tax=Amphiura filiformis TaxID=82378 RepID=UPI003B21AEA2